MSLARALRRRRRALQRRIRRAVRRQARRATRRLSTRIHAWRTKRARHRAEIRQARAAASPLTPRSITGTPRPARTPTATIAPAPRKAAAAPHKAAPMKQRVKRDKGGKFNGSTSGGKKTTAKKAAASKPTAEQRKAAQFQRALSAGNNRVARVDKRTDAADARLDRAFGHDHD